ncbi:MAG: protoglobin domain-containing protein [Nitrospiraceae bacterium]
MEDWQIRKEFLLFTEEEEASLKTVRPLMERHVNELVDAFYQHLLAFEETRRLLSNEMIGSRLKEAQKGYLLSLVTGPYDQTYQEGRLQIGKVHERIGLTPQWYLGAYALYLNLLRPLLTKEFGSRPGQLEATLTALTKAMFLDMQLAIEAYILKSSERLEVANLQLARLTRELEQGLMKKKKDLEQTLEQLRQTERLAELGALASGMAHEIGTPMNVILGRAEYLMRRTEEESTKKGLETIVAQVERITKIMNQLLTFARRRPIERRATDITKTIEDGLEILQEQLKHHHIKIERAVEPSIPLIHADKDQMSQVVLNILLNAIHSMPDGGTLRIDLAMNDGHVNLAVTDTGCGISKANLPKIFDPFYTTKDIGKGTGLGLTVVHGIIQEHGGTIRVESEPGRGTTFTLSLPTYQHQGT